MRFPAETIAAALQMFYEGAMLKGIADTLGSHGERAPNFATIHRWIVRFTTAAVGALAEPTPDVDGAWLAVESRIDSRAFGGRPAWLWDVFDGHTGYLLGSKLSSDRQTSGPRPALQAATMRAGKNPTQVDVANWTPDGQPDGQPDGRVSQRFKPHLDRRLDVVRATTRENMLRLVMAGWRVDYNLFRPQPELGGLTPAKIANVSEGFESWEGVVAIS
jgi:hypothetical protein